MTPGLSKAIRYHVRSYSFLCLQMTRADIREQLKWAVKLIIADGLYNIPQGCDIFTIDDFSKDVSISITASQYLSILLNITDICKHEKD